MSGQWINAAKVVKLLAKYELNDDNIKHVVAALAGRSIVGVVKQCSTVISLFDYAIRSKSEPAWELLCMLYRHTAFTQAHTVLEADEADDVAQEVMLQLWIKRDRLEQVANLGGWVRVLAKNRAIDVIRSHKAYVDATNGEVGGDSEDMEYLWLDPDESEVDAVELQSNIDWDTPEEMAIAEDTLDRVVAAHEKLSPLSRKIMDLMSRGYTYAEVAEAVGCTEETARQSVSRAEKFMEWNATI